MLSRPSTDAQELGDPDEFTTQDGNSPNSIPRLPSFQFRAHTHTAAGLQWSLVLSSTRIK